MLRTGHLRIYLSIMKSRGFDEDAVVANTGIQLERMSDPEYVIDVSQSHNVMLNMLKLTGDVGLGLELGTAINFTDLGIVGYAMASSGTLDQAIGLWMQYGVASTGSPFKPTLISPGEGGRWSITAFPLGYKPALFRIYLEGTLAFIHRFSELLTGQPLIFSEIKFSYARPQYWKAYEDIFRCKLIFNASSTTATVKSPRLSETLLAVDSDVRELCIRHCTHLIQKINRTSAVSSKLREILMHRGAVLDLEQASVLMNMSQRTLRRRLLDEDTSFQKVLDEFRCDLAREYLLSRAMTVKEIAYLLGFSNSNSFCRAFKAWTGQTAGSI